MRLIKNYTSYKSLALTILIWLAALYTYAQQSVLAEGTWIKFSVSEEGIYKINANLLSKAGINPAAINPKQIKIYGNPGGMLPQSNSAVRPIDLLELSIYVEGEIDGKFDNNDFILFYAQGADQANYNSSKNIFAYDKNIYAEENFYFLTAEGANGKRISTLDNQVGAFPRITTYNDYAFHEINQENILKSGRQWYGEKFDYTTSYNLPFTISGVVPNSPITIVSSVMAKSFEGSSFNIFFNNNKILEQPIAPIPNTRYGEKGRNRIDTIIVNASTIQATLSDNQTISYQYIKGGSGESIGYLDFVLLSFERQLALYNNKSIFVSVASLNNVVSTFEIDNANSQSLIWDVSNYTDPLIQSFTLSNNKASFSTSTTSLKKFIAVNTNQLPAPTFKSKVINQNLHELSTPNLIIVTHPAFLTEANRLAQHRQSQGMSVVATTVNQIYNEFSSGRQDITAIRDFVKYLYDKNPAKLKSLLLFGKSSYDYRDQLSNNTNYVPTYESRNSLHPLETYSSDDFFGLLEDSEGDWEEGFSPGNNTLDIGVGRIPVRITEVDNEEAKRIVDKLIYYDTREKNLGKWKKQIVFIADDGDNNIHQDQANKLSKLVEQSNPEFDTRKIFLDAFPQLLQSAGERSPETNKSILESLDQGSLIINYTGHGSERQFADERIFDDVTITILKNKNYPLFVTATCEFGRHDDPYDRSSAERCLLQKDGGSIGMVSTARPVSSNTNFELNKAFYNALFLMDDNKPITLGEVFKRTKNNSLSGISNRNFSLLGDPSLTLAFPSNQIRVTSITTEEQEDTLKALSHVTIKGEIVDPAAERITDFNGILQAVLYDKETNFVTLGNENSPFNYKQWVNTLFRGKAEVSSGEFEFDFVVTKNIAYQLGSGKLSLYAMDNNSFMDAGGVSVDFVVGLSNTNPETDNLPPTVNIYIGDTSFENGGIASPDTRLIVQLSDENGINIASYGIGNSLIAILDDTTTYVLNNYYEADLNNYKNGWVNFPLEGLSPGHHTISVKAWDTYNNRGEASISFVITDGEAIKIEDFGNYPNPFRDQTTLFFSHNRSGDDLMARVSIFDITGTLLRTEELIINSSPYRVELLDYEGTNDFGEKLGSGVYLAYLFVRSLTNGSKNEQVTKLIILN